MVDRLEIIPGDVRGGGNITIPKNFSEDKNTNVYSTFLSENEVTIEGREMSAFHSYYSNWYQLTIESDAPRIVSPGGDATFNVTVTNPARENVNGVHVEVSLRSKDGENEYWASSFDIMDDQPVFSLWVPEDCDKYCEWFIHATQGGYNGVGLHRSVIVADVTDISLDAFGDKQIIQTGETCNVIGLLTGKLGESVIGIPGQTVNFYEQWTPGLRVSAPRIIQSGDTVDIKAQLIDTVDGSLVRESGVPIKVYQQVPYDVIEEWPANGYQTHYNDTPLEIYGQMKKNGDWGGLRIYGADNDHHYCYIGQGSATNDENAKIFYKITNSSDWTDFSVDIWRDKVALYIGSHKVEEVSCDISEPVSVWGGSNANPVSVQNLRIRDITAE